MAEDIPAIDDAMRGWIARQRIFFVSTAPLSGEGHVNCSPKGGDFLRVLDGIAVVYLDFIGSGAETIAHLRENGRIVLMFCAFEGPPRIVRFHGRGEVILPNDPAFSELASHLDHDLHGVRSVIRVNVDRIAQSCGFGVPLYEFVKDRDGMRKWCEHRDTAALRDYAAQKNATSIDGLPALSKGEVDIISPAREPI
jgi:hypothetical protein